MAIGKNEINIIIKAVTSQFEKGIFTVQKGLSDLGHKANSASKSADEFSKKLEGVGRIGKTVAVVAGAVSASMGALAIASLKLAGDVEQQRVAFKGLLGSYEEADAIIKRIRQEAARTPFETAPLTRMTQQLTTITKDGNKALDILLSLGDAAAASGRGSAELELIIQNLVQVASTGKVTEMDIRQFQGAIPLFNDIITAAGLTTEELKNSRNAAELLFYAFKKSAQQGGITAGAMAEQAKTLGGLWSTFTDETSGALTSLGNKLLPIAKPVLKFFIDLINYVKTLSPEMKTLISVIGGVVLVVSSLATGLGVLAAILPSIAAGIKLLGISATGFSVGLGAISLAITAISAAIIYWEEIAWGFDVFTTRLGKSIVGTWYEIKIKFLEMLQSMVEAFNKFTEKIPFGEKLKIGVGGLKEAIQDAKELKKQVESIPLPEKPKKSKPTAPVTPKKTSQNSSDPIPAIEGDSQEEKRKKELRSRLKQIDQDYYDATTEADLLALEQRLLNFDTEELKKLELYEQYVQLKREIDQNQANWLAIQDQKAEQQQEMHLRNQRLSFSKYIRDKMGMTELQGKQFATWLEFMAGASRSKNKELAAISKAYALYDVGIKTYQAAQASYSALAGIPYVGPALGAAAAIAALAFGAEQAANITAAQPALAQGGMVSATAGGRSVTVAEAGKDEAVIPLDDPETARRIQEASGGGNLNVNLIMDGQILAQGMVENYNRGRDINMVTRLSQR